ncbi:MAG: hypothetical protein Q7U04_10535 [Bacteriovorax sp.]|nr:hypothetical protein [Bacteriovorax sp.]
MSNEDTLISKLIEETCAGPAVNDQPNNSTDLRKYFEKRLNQVDFISIGDYLDQHHLTHQSLIFQNNSSCYRLSYNESVLDFPSNWSVFQSIKNSDLIYVDQTLDQDFLLDIFSEVSGAFQNLLIINENQSVKLVFLPDEESRDHVNWMRNFFEKKNALNVEQEKEAA